ncbi:hypothetical protein JCM15764A_30200 [Geotalea toluenoxydans]
MSRGVVPYFIGGKLMLPNLDRHPVKRVNSATEVINEKTSITADNPQTTLAAVQR